MFQQQRITRLTRMVEDLRAKLKEYRQRANEFEKREQELQRREEILETAIAKYQEAIITLDAVEKEYSSLIKDVRIMRSEMLRANKKHAK